MTKFNHVTLCSRCFCSCFNLSAIATMLLNVGRWKSTKQNKIKLSIPLKDIMHPKVSTSNPKVNRDSLVTQKRKKKSNFSSAQFFSLGLLEVSTISGCGMTTRVGRTMRPGLSRPSSLGTKSATNLCYALMNRLIVFGTKGVIQFHKQNYAQLC